MWIKTKIHDRNINHFFIFFIVFLRYGSELATVGWCKVLKFLFQIPKISCELETHKLNLKRLSIQTDHLLAPEQP